MTVISGTDQSGEPERAAELVIVGAGITGLSIAHLVSMRCDAAIRIVVLDKARGVGGRLATRRVGDATFDHGAPEFNVRCEPLRELVDAAERDGSVARSGDSARGIPTMTAFPKWIARSLTTSPAAEPRAQPSILPSTQVRSIERFGDRWRLLGDGFSVIASIVILTCPVPQSLALLDEGAVTLDVRDRSALDRISYSPCIAMLATMAGTPAVLRSTSDFARAHWDDSDASIVEAMTATGPDSFGVTSGSPAASVHRWKFARAVERLDQALLMATGLPPLIFAGDAFGPGDVDGAVASAFAAHSEILDLLRNLA